MCIRDSAVTEQRPLGIGAARGLTNSCCCCREHGEPAVLEERVGRGLLLGTKAEPCRSASRAKSETVEQDRTCAGWNCVKGSVGKQTEGARHAGIVQWGRRDCYAAGVIIAYTHAYHVG